MAIVSEQVNPLGLIMSSSSSVVLVGPSSWRTPTDEMVPPDGLTGDIT